MNSILRSDNPQLKPKQLMYLYFFNKSQLKPKQLMYLIYFFGLEWWGTVASLGSQGWGKECRRHAQLYMYHLTFFAGTTDYFL